MNKKFDEWNIQKQRLDKQKKTFYVNTREVWFTKMGVNVRFEENGKTEFLRPVLVLKRVGNLFFTVALTSKGKDDHSFYHKLEEVFLTEKNIKYQETSYVILSQVKVMDKKRFTQNVGNVSQEEYKKVQKKLKHILF